MPRRGPKKLDGYIRVSRVGGRDKDAERYISPRVQRDAIQKWADYRGVDIAAWHTDEDESGGTQDRPGLREAMQRVQAGETEGIACWRLNRFARNVADAIGDVEAIQVAGGHLAFVEEDIDPTGPFGSFILTVLLAVATLERENIAAGWNTARARAIDRGAFPTRLKLGYKRRPDGGLEPSDRAPVIRQAFLLAASQGVHAAVPYLEREVPERRWTPSAVRRLLASRTYLGEARHGELVNLEAHEPLVTRAEWEAAQAPPSVRRRAPDSFPLTGFLTCGGCGGRMIGGRTGSRSKRAYRCSNAATFAKRKGAHCPAPAIIPAEALEDHCRSTLLAAWHDRGGWTLGSGDVDLAAAHQAVIDAEEELNAFAADQTIRKALGASYGEHLQARVDTLEAARGTFREAANASHAALAHVSLDDVLQSATGAELAQVLRGTLDNIVVSRGRGPIGDRVRLFQRGGDELVAVPGSQNGENSAVQAGSGVGRE